MDTNQKFAIIYNSDEEGRKKLLAQMSEEEQAFYHEWAKQQARPAAVRATPVKQKSGVVTFIKWFVGIYVAAFLLISGYNMAFQVPKFVDAMHEMLGCKHGIVVNGELLTKPQAVAQVRWHGMEIGTDSGYPCYQISVTKNTFTRHCREK